MLAGRGDRVLAVCRKPTPELRELPVQLLEGFDVSSDSAMDALAEAVGPDAIDVVICNAGINLSYACGIGDLDLGTLKREFEVNTFGPVRTVRALLPRLRKGSKIAIVSTWRPGLGAASRNYGYQMSKVAANQLAFLLADELKTRGIATILLSPGPMDTQLLRDVVASGHAKVRLDQAQAPLDVARDLVGLVDALSLERSGSWLFRTGEDMGATATRLVHGH